MHTVHLAIQYNGHDYIVRLPCKRMWQARQLLRKVRQSSKVVLLSAFVT